MVKLHELVVISGKGGTGKTTIAAGLGALLSPLVMADYDVDAANLHLALKARRVETNVFMAGWEPRVGQDCTSCGICTGACRYKAIEAGRIIDRFACEGCGACALVCPMGAVEMVEAEAGEWIISETPYGPLVHAELGAGRENSGKLVAKVKDVARTEAAKGNYRLLLGDGPPGIACAAIAAISRASAVLIVTEPGLTGQHDLARAVELCRHFRLDPLVCLNKHDLWPAGADQVEDYCHDHGLVLAGRIPCCDSVNTAARTGATVMEVGSPAIRRALSDLAEVVMTHIPR